MTARAVVWWSLYGLAAVAVLVGWFVVMGQLLGLNR